MPLNRYNDFRNLIALQYSTTTQEMVDKAILFAWQRLQNITRYDNTPMLDHGIGVARIVVEEIGLGRNSTVAAIIHDVVRIAVQEHPEDVEALTAEISRDFGDEVLGISLALSKISLYASGSIYFNDRSSKPLLMLYRPSLCAISAYRLRLSQLFERRFFSGKMSSVRITSSLSASLISITRGSSE